MPMLSAMASRSKRSSSRKPGNTSPYRQDAVAEGLFDVLHRVQGQNRTWFGGSTFSHELVSSVVNHAHDLIPGMIENLSPLSASRAKAA